jgi:hypothetical protein
VPTNIWRLFKPRSNRICSDSCFEFDAGNTDNSVSSTELQDLLALTRLVDWDTGAFLDWRRRKCDILRPIANDTTFTFCRAKQGFVIYRIRVRRGNRKKHVPKGATYGKPVHHGVNHLKYQRSLRSTAEERVGRKCGNLRILNSYWINQDGVYKYFDETPESAGSSTPFTSTEKLAVLLPMERRAEVKERVTDSTRLLPERMLLSVAAILFNSDVIDSMVIICRFHFTISIFQLVIFTFSCGVLRVGSVRFAALLGR